MKIHTVGSFRSLLDEIMSQSLEQFDRRVGHIVVGGCILVGVASEYGYGSELLW